MEREGQSFDVQPKKFSLLSYFKILHPRQLLLRFQTVLTLEKREFIHFVKVFFCTSLCSSRKKANEVNLKKTRLSLRSNLLMTRRCPQNGNTSCNLIWVKCSEEHFSGHNHFSQFQNDNYKGKSKHISSFSKKKAFLTCFTIKYRVLLASIRQTVHIRILRNRLGEGREIRMGYIQLSQTGWYGWSLPQSLQHVNMWLFSAFP